MTDHAYTKVNMRDVRWDVNNELQKLNVKQPDDFGADTANAPASSYEAVNSPAHYSRKNGENPNAMECIDAIEDSMTREQFVGFLRGNAMKYLWRYDKKGKALEDLQKAMWYLERLTFLYE